MALQLIEAGQLQSPYREFDLVVPVNSEYKLTYYHHTVEVIAASSSKYSVSFGSGTGYTSLQEGIAYSYPNLSNGDIGAMSSITIKNESQYPLSISVALGGGTIQDNRLIGDVNVSGKEDMPVFTRQSRGTALDSVAVTIGTDGTATFTPSPECIEYVLQNQTGANIRLQNATTGLIVYDGGSITLTNTDTLPIYGTAGRVVSVLENLVL